MICRYLLIIWRDICCHFDHPSAGRLSHFKPSIPTCPPTFHYTGSVPWGINISYSLGTGKQCRNQESHLAWKWKQLRWMAKPAAALHFWVSFQQYPLWIELKKNLILVGFTSTLVSLWRASYLEVQLLLHYCIWFSSAFEIRQCCQHAFFITNISMILPPRSIIKSCFLSGMEDIVKN